MRQPGKKGKEKLNRREKNASPTKYDGKSELRQKQQYIKSSWKKEPSTSIAFFPRHFRKRRRNSQQIGMKYTNTNEVIAIIHIEEYLRHELDFVEYAFPKREREREKGVETEPAKCRIVSIRTHKKKTTSRAVRSEKWTTDPRNFVCVDQAMIVVMLLEHY